ncbi:hypothetical protein GCM10008910_48580 [Faecalicatena orotica]|uniref:Glycosyl hydrolase family 38 n=1 Tax=Faecalicatena orotica TaxID=1544 RepID=A0A2Y9BL89_9FIRM|nr:hypothetical protein [Faecalicatena orotica]PWJ17382.1 glycosyl hydrolase family 38 [Faecalicatena orotica]SSA58809.1 Glycosyl hydrolases family 38 N-terminal domain-containing protein [Faecalicatena orotica]
MKKIYVVHHSHTDIGYTDLQERIIYNQVCDIQKAIRIIKEGYAKQTVEKQFKWNCETYFCVEKFLEMAEPREKEDFFRLVKKGNIGISANYLNFNDLADCEALDRKTKHMLHIFGEQGIKVDSAMTADINGMSMGVRDVLIENGIEFLFTNIHTHHGMFPLHKNQEPYFWKSENGRRLLVWSGDHYNLGNKLGIIPTKNRNLLLRNAPENEKYSEQPIEMLYQNIRRMIEMYSDTGYSYDFYIAALSGLHSDNAPPNPEALHIISDFHEKYGDEIRIEMVTLSELYGLIKDQAADAPEYTGDLNDWWADGVGSTPYVVKHYKEAQRLGKAADRLEKRTGKIDGTLKKASDDNLLLYAEHTWGDSATVTEPYSTMALNQDLRNNSYASKAHEANNMRKNVQLQLLGDIREYFETKGTVKAINLGGLPGEQLVEFYIESFWNKVAEVKITDCETGEILVSQVSPHPRGVLISFIACFEAGQEKLFLFEEQIHGEETDNNHRSVAGIDYVRDVMSPYDSKTCYLPYQLENEWFCLRYKVGEGITSFYNKKTRTEMLKDGYEKFFTPVYERTPVYHDVFRERTALGRNIRGINAQHYQAELKNVTVLEDGPVFTKIQFDFQLEGTRKSLIILQFFKELPRIQFTYKIAKCLSEDIESVYLPLSLETAGSEQHIIKGGRWMRPGIDQIPGTCMEFYMSDCGMLYQGKEGSILINTLDTPLLYYGEMEHHAIKLCDGSVEDNKRPVYSWIMNNVWETNFKLDLSGYCEFRYSLEFCGTGDINTSRQRLLDNDLGNVAFIAG